jgi:hypothetical protein
LGKYDHTTHILGGGAVYVPLVLPWPAAEHTPGYRARLTVTGSVFPLGPGVFTFGIVVAGTPLLDGDGLPFDVTFDLAPSDWFHFEADVSLVTTSAGFVGVGAKVAGTYMSDVVGRITTARQKAGGPYTLTFPGGDVSVETYIDYPPGGDLSLNAVEYSILQPPDDLAVIP